MPEFLTTGCVLVCSFGAAPSEFDALELPGKPVINGGLVAGTILEIVPEENVLSFGMCSSLANPEVASATTAAGGVLTPMPCVPAIPDPWDPPSELVSFNGVPLATVDSMCSCAFGGEISVDIASEFIAATQG